MFGFTKGLVSDREFDGNSAVAALLDQEEDGSASGSSGGEGTSLFKTRALACPR